MTPVDKDIIRRKLAIIVENLGALEPIGEMPRDRYLQDVYKRKATERLLQELIEAAIDINTHLLVQEGPGAPDDYYESFIRAQGNAVSSLCDLRSGWRRRPASEIGWFMNWFMNMIALIPIRCSAQSRRRMNSIPSTSERLRIISPAGIRSRCHGQR